MISSPDILSRLTITGDGQILACGTSLNSPTASTTLVIDRYSKDGVPDASFGIDGQATIQLAASESGIEPSADAIEAVSNGAILAAGADSDGFFIARVDASGDPDATFGTNGILHFANSSMFETQFPVIEVDSQGRFDVSGSASVNSTSISAIARFNPDGRFDGSFGTAGVSTLSALAGAGVGSMAIGPDGSIFVAGGNALAKLEG